MMLQIAFFRLAGACLKSCGCLVFAFLVLPILAIVPLSFTAGVELVYPMPGWSLRWYEDFFSRSEWLFSVRNSLIVGVASASLAMVLGTAAALGLARQPKAFQAAVGALIVLPMATPIVVTSVSLFFFYATLGLSGTFTGLILSHATIALPFVFISVRASLTGLSPDYARAAASLGASRWRTFHRVVAPLIMPGIVSGGLFAFAVSLDDVVVAMFVGGPGQLTLPRQMFAGVRENISPTILAAATMMIGLSIVLMFTTNRLAARSSRLQPPSGA